MRLFGASRGQGRRLIMLAAAGVLAAGLAAKLRELARAEGTTLFVVLLAGYQTLLHRLGGQDDFIVSDRLRPEQRMRCTFCSIRAI